MQPIYILAKTGNIEAIKSLSQEDLYNPASGYYIDATDNNNRTALFLAACNGHVDIVELLLQKGANASICDINKHSVLHVVIWLFANKEMERENLSKMLNLLLKANYNLVNLKDSLGMTPLDMARKSEAYDEISRIIQSSAPVKKSYGSFWNSLKSLLPGQSSQTEENINLTL